MSSRDKVGSAILGFYAAIKLCVADGYDWRRVAELVAPIAREHGETIRRAKAIEAHIQQAETEVPTAPESTEATSERK